MSKTERNFIILAAVWAAIMLLFCAVESAGADTIPYNTYIASDWSNLHALLDGKTGVDKAAGAMAIQPWGHINWEAGGQIQAGTQLWVVANNDRQVVGCINVLVGRHNLG